MKRRVSCLMIALLMLVAAAFPAGAAEIDEVSPAASAYIARYSAEVTKTGGTTFNIFFDVVATGTMELLGARRIQVKQSEDNSNWSTYDTITPDEWPELQSTNTGYHGMEKNYTAPGGYYYKIYVSFYAYKSTNNHGTIHDYSNVIYIP